MSDFRQHISFWPERLHDSQGVIIFFGKNQFFVKFLIKEGPLQLEVSIPVRLRYPGGGKTSLSRTLRLIDFKLLGL